MDIDNLIQKVREYCPQCEPEFLRQAYAYAENAYGSMKTGPGESSLRHTLQAAMILAEFHLDSSAIAAALLQDVLTLGGATLETVQEKFGQDTARLVGGISRLNNITWGSLEEEQAEGLRKMFLAMADDLRVVLIKLGGQLSRMRNLAALPDIQREVAVRETMKIFAPLANRLGIWSFKSELEDLAFQHSDPERYSQIRLLLAESKAAREEHIDAIIARLKAEMKAHGIRAEVSGRPKHMFSIYQKMKMTSRSFDEIHDVQGVRIIVEDIKNCYAALDVVHRLWKPRLEEFDDYIANPKHRTYRSIHTTVTGPKGKPLEIQIRTLEMDRIAEMGVAAHWRYKEKVGVPLGMEDKIAYLRGLLDWQRDLPLPLSPGEERVYVFTPKGDVIEMPSGATPVDFAYLIHTNLGHHCRGAKVNGKLVSLDYRVQTGDRIEILTSKGASPSRDWLNPQLGYVFTRPARQKILQWFRRKDKEESLSRGREALEREIKRAGIKDKNYEEMARRAQLAKPKDLFEAVACGNISPRQLVSKMTKLRPAGEEELAPLFRTPPAPGPARVLVKGVKDLLTRQARCCNPLPGEKVIGYITRGRGVSIHRHDCHNITIQKDSPRLIEVEWGKDTQTGLASVRIVSSTQKDLLKKFSAIVEDEKANISSLDVSLDKKAALTTIVATLEIGSIGQLNRILNKIKKLPSVIDARR
jgi:RelA/SpoT family (p)ppGpp synthetase